VKTAEQRLIFRNRDAHIVAPFYTKAQSRNTGIRWDRSIRIIEETDYD